MTFLELLLELLLNLTLSKTSQIKYPKNIQKIVQTIETKMKYSMNKDGEFIHIKKSVYKIVLLQIQDVN